MNYDFVDSPIILRRIDRRTAKQKRWAEEKAIRNRERKLEIYSVKELVADGFYEAIPKIPAYGIEIWTRNCTVRDELSNWQWDNRKIHTFSLSLPTNKNLESVKKIFPMYWEESNTYYCGFVQRPAIVMWCIFDLLSRVLYLPHWDNFDSIPLRWRLGNQKTRNLAEHYVKEINALGKFNVPPPKPEWQGSVNATRHKATPYDYEWQTKKTDRDIARGFWNKKILEYKSPP